MLLLLLLACIRFRLPEETDDSAAEPVRDPEIVWGDLHNHTNLSHDGCEDPDNQCLPDAAREDLDGGLPAVATYTRAAEHGLGFAALTDHAEFSTYRRLSAEPGGGGDTGADEGFAVDLDIWAHMQGLVREAESAPAFGVLGYEWTSSCTGVEGDYQATHRTVLIEEIEACAQWRIPSCRGDGFVAYGALERYGYSTEEPQIRPSDLLARLQAVPTVPGCAASRWVGFFHHTAQDRPAWVDWASAESRVAGDTVVEIASEHGSSECDMRVSGDDEACQWRYSSEHHVDDGSIQYMLQQGHKLGFVGGTDNHMDEPGRVTEGPGRVRDLQAGPNDPEPWHDQYSEGTLTGAVHTGQGFDRADLFDALQARHTVVASWAAEGLVIYATGMDGVRYLPGDDVPAAAMPLVVTARLDDPRVTAWTFQVVDPAGPVSTDAALTIPPGEARYVRLVVDQEGEAHRVFASPFFAE